MKNYVTHLECALTGEKKQKNIIHGLSDAGKPLLVRYDLDSIRNEIKKDNIIKNGFDGFWRYGFLLPVDDGVRVK